MSVMDTPCRCFADIAKTKVTGEIYTIVNLLWLSPALP